MTLKALKFFVLIAYFLISPLSNATTSEEQGYSNYSIDQLSEASSGEIFQYYAEQEGENLNLDSIMLENSKRLKLVSPEIHFKHELARVVYYKNKNRKDRFVPILYELKTADLLNENAELSASFYTLSGIIYYDMQRPGEARNYYIQGLGFYKSSGDSTGMKGNLINIGNTHFSESNYDSALYYFQNALQFSNAGIEEFDLNLKNNLATVYQNLERYDEAELIYKELIGSHDTTKRNSHSISTTHYNLGIVYQKQAQHDWAIDAFKQALNDDINFNSGTKNSNIYYGLSRSYALINNHSLAYENFKIADSLRRLEDELGANRLMDEFNLKHQTQLFNEKQLLTKEKIENEKQLKQVYFAFLLFALLLLSIIFLLYVKKNQKNAMLAKKNLELTESKKRLKDQTKPISTDLIHKLEETLIHKKAFCRQDITLEKLARQLKTNRTYLSETVNAHFGISFSKLINKLRIQEARELLIDKKFMHYSIEGISQSVGYKSISSFNSTFKKETGITPSYFRKKNK